MLVIDGDELTLTAPEDTVWECNEARNERALAQWLSSVSVASSCENARVTNDFTGLSDDCGLTGSTTVTWTAQDDCGNTAAHTASFSVVDTTAPTLEGPDDVTVECQDEDTVRALERWLGAATASDLCGQVELTSETVQRSGGCGEIGTTRATWTATDDCGNVSTHVATFTITGTTAPPVIHVPDDRTVECDGSGNTQALRRWASGATVEGGCGDVSFTYAITRSVDPCGETSVRHVTWTATDDCGHVVTESATFTVEDTTLPALTVPPDRLDFCAGGGDLGELRVWLTSAAAEDECGDVAVSNDFSRDRVSEACDVLVTWTAIDACGNAASDAATAAIEDSEPPVLSLNGSAELTAECGVDRYAEPGATVIDACDTGLAQAEVGGQVVDTSQPGTYIVEYGARDLCRNEAESISRTVEVVDTLAPFAPDGIAVELWPSNHRYETLSLADCVRDLCELDLDVNAVGTILSIYSDEPEDAASDGNTVQDIVILSNSTFMVRAERQGGGNGRVYGVTFEISDSAGNTTVDTCLIGVPHDASGGVPVDEGPEAGYSVLP
jgi:hypothetical protein